MLFRYPTRDLFGVDSTVNTAGGEGGGAEHNLVPENYVGKDRTRDPEGFGAGEASRLTYNSERSELGKPKTHQNSRVISK